MVPFVKRCWELLGGRSPRLNWSQALLFPFFLIMCLSILRRCGRLWYWDESGKLIQSEDYCKFLWNEPLGTRWERAKAHCSGTGCTQGEWRLFFFMSQMSLSPPSYPRNAPRGTEPLHVRAGKRISLYFPQDSLYEVFLLVLQEVIPVLLWNRCWLRIWLSSILCGRPVLWWESCFSGDLKAINWFLSCWLMYPTDLALLLLLSPSVVPDSVTAAHQAFLSFSIPWNLLRLVHNESVMPSNHLTSIFLSIRVISSSSVSHFFASGGQSIGASASASVLPMNIQDWFPLELTGLISLQSKGLSRVISNTTIRKHQFLGTQPSLWSNSHICTWLLEKP